MFGLTKREQRWAAEQKAAETLVPLAIAAIEARTSMDTNERIAALERDLAAAQADVREHIALCIAANKLIDEARAEAAALRQNAHRGAWMIKFAEWWRDGDETRMVIRVADKADLSCYAMREIAIDAAIDQAKEGVWP